MPTKSANNAVELSFINFIPANNTLNFTATPISGGAPIVDATAGVYANGAFAQANAAFSSANNVAPQIQPAFSTANSAALYANGAFIKANSAAQYGTNTITTSALAIPYGTTAERPASPQSGMMRYNSSNNLVEIYMPSVGWKILTTDAYSIEVLIIAGGGAGIVFNLDAALPVQYGGIGMIYIIKAKYYEPTPEELAVEAIVATQDVNNAFIRDLPNDVRNVDYNLTYLNQDISVAPLGLFVFEANNEAAAIATYGQGGGTTPEYSAVVGSPTYCPTLAGFQPPGKPTF